MELLKRKKMYCIADKLISQSISAKFGNFKNETLIFTNSTHINFEAEIKRIAREAKLQNGVVYEKKCAPRLLRMHF